MILNISLRTDIVACYTDWLVDKLLHKDFIYSQNPRTKVTTAYSLKDVDCIAFCSKDYSKILPYIQEINSKYKCIYYYTITPSGTDLEPHVPSVDESIKTLKELSKIVGKENVLWRFDPLLKTNKISCEWLVDSFEKMAKELSKYVSRCIFSFITPYSHTLANMPEIIPFTEEEKDWITMRMGVIAISENNLHLQICRLGKEYPGVYVEGCMSPKIFGLNIKPTKASITSGCTCSVQTYGIGEYDTCKMGCKYCYATIDHNLAKRIPENPNSELISGEITEPIKYVNNRVQISQELSLFD